MTNQASNVVRIIVEYSDGGRDTLTSRQGGDCPLYSLDREPVHSTPEHGLYTSAAVAVLLYSTAMNMTWTAYSSSDKSSLILTKAWASLSS